MDISREKVIGEPEWMIEPCRQHWELNNKMRYYLHRYNYTEGRYVYASVGHRYDSIGDAKAGIEKIRKQEADEAAWEKANPPIYID